jgi:uncharacterized protein (TIGR03000 family)
MKSVLLLVSSLLVFDVQAAIEWSRATPPTQRRAAAAPRITSHISVTVPHEQAELIIEGQTIPGTGTSRQFETPLLAPGTMYRYRFTTTWRPNTYTTITRRRTVAFRGGAPVAVDLTVEDPSDRVRVQYVPTPDDVADEMVKLAGITAGDVAYEPGCGDARITIAAVKGGASRGVGIDIDPERVAESRAKVKQAGLENKIEIRLGDALDIRDLSTATVVFLYMGDHFNSLIRPILWKQLKVGARVVSHRFTMGDWKPDKSVTVTSEFGGEYELHLWTVTEELKRKMASPSRLE